MTMTSRDLSRVDQYVEQCRKYWTRVSVVPRFARSLVLGSEFRAQTNKMSKQRANVAECSLVLTIATRGLSGFVQATSDLSRLVATCRIEHGGRFSGIGADQFLGIF